MVILYLILYLSDLYYSNWVKGQFLEKPSWVINMKNKHFGIGFLGSSRVYNMVNMDIIEKKTGYNSINMGSGGASCMENYITLKFFLDNNNKLDNLYLQIDASNLIDMHKAFSYPFREYVFFGKMNDEELSEAIKLNNGYLKYYFWKYVPFVRYAEFSHVFSLRYLIKPLSEKEDNTAYFDSTKGSALLLKSLMPDSLLKKCNDIKGWPLTIDTTSLKYLNKIIDLANEKKINMVLYKAPIYSCYYEKSKIGVTTENCIDSISKSRKLKYDDFQNLSLSSDHLKFKDYYHLNETGANILSSILADSIVKRKIKN